MIFRNLDGTTKTSFSIGTPSAPLLRLGHYVWDERTVTQSTTGTAFTAYHTWNTVVLPVGTYVLDFNFLWNCGSAKRNIEFEVRQNGTQRWLTINRSVVAGGLQVSEMGKVILSVGAAASQAIDLRFRNQTAGTTLTLLRNLFTLMRVR